MDMSPFGAIGIMGEPWPANAAGFMPLAFIPCRPICCPVECRIAGPSAASAKERLRYLVTAAVVRYYRSLIRLFAARCSFGFAVAWRKVLHLRGIPDFVASAGHYSTRNVLMMLTCSSYSVMASRDSFGTPPMPLGIPFGSMPLFMYGFMPAFIMPDCCIWFSCRLTLLRHLLYEGQLLLRADDYVPMLTC
ncbi:hypothetical protein MRB53_038098 [Persea americana]|nr:hypothetical protein MRB53_038098 [Persea americana]